MDKLNKKSSPSILLTIDVEDWFQVENFKGCIPFSTWSDHELRVEKNAHQLLDLFDSIIFDSKLNTQHPTLNTQHSTLRKKVQCTFFILGWIAERLPHLVREIHSRGHEVASHGYNHNLCTECSAVELRKDLTDSKKLLEDIIGTQVLGYRSPSFAVNNDILKTIQDCGYHYDSSFNSFGLHDRYGKLNLNGYKKKGMAYQIPSTQYLTPNTQNSAPITHNPKPNTQHPDLNTFFELPVSNLSFSIFRLPSSVFHCTWPWGGGGYFRLIPFPIFKRGVQSILKNEGAYILYLHPWEIDPKQPRVNEASSSYKFRHYVNLKNTYSKLKKLITKFPQADYMSCIQYINQLN